MSFPKTVAVFAVAVMTMASAANAALVVRSVGNGAAAFPVGRTVMPGTPIKLAAGDMLTVLDGQATRTFRGPGMFDLGRAAQATTTLAAASAALDAQTATRKPRLGTVRSVMAPIRNSLWDIEVDAPMSTSSSAQCIVDPTNIILRRADTIGDRTLMIAARGNPENADAVSFLDGNSSAVWPRALPASNSYTLVEGTSQRVITFAKVAPPTGDAVTDAKMLIAAGCTRQLEKMVSMMDRQAN